MTIKKLIAEIHRKKSFLCIGLDTDMDKIPPFLLKEADPIFAFNKAIIDATHHLCVAYKPNTAFYEAYGIKGWKSFEKTISYLNKNYPEIFTIADAKRGDIGNTSRMYAKVFFQDLGFDSVTVAPYMGKDSVEPFLKFDNKHTILLALTSNQGAFDFQTKLLTDKALYQHVLEVSKSWVNSQNLMYVFGATKAEFLVKVRDIMPDNFLLVPGVGAQGGNLKDISKYGMNDNVGLLVNSSRAIIYASADEDFAQMAANSASKLQEEMKKLLFQKFTSLKN
ncbi:orotidine-5'-phosphate decarboxylase [Flavobacteriaceae bacterium]|jgi:orotidine-5'-phosphate decarboxylase|nr:orotidine-5'-phosphate decarboxylase [Bacteroidota bacterium]MDC0957801.1 orotidine-5'-phosphate decarboxylase [Flavobacteriaceae bacterium]MDC1051852.1 orotidine-5'-phosphate decarboxylase [Flavobacteriaceae bacterium]MDC3268914.1 orotidine-5'-phosphate decarboxylase [Flavobacteriaceae bacterium]